MIVIDKLCYQSGLRHVNAGEKFAFAMITLLLCVVSRSIACACIVLAATGILTVWKGGIPVFRYLKLMTVPLAFLLLSTLAIIIDVSKTRQDFLALPLGDWYVGVTFSSFFYALQLIGTALAAVSCLYFLSLSTPMPDILNVLRAIHCPTLLCELMLLIYRFIFILMEVASAITISQHSRLGNRNYRTSLKSFSALASVLLLRSFKRANALYDAMEARCYDGTIRVLNESFPPKAGEILCFALLDLLFLAVMVLERIQI